MRKKNLPAAAVPLRKATPVEKEKANELYARGIFAILYGFGVRLTQIGMLVMLIWGAVAFFTAGVEAIARPALFLVVLVLCMVGFVIGSRKETRRAFTLYEELIQSGLLGENHIEEKVTS